ncbi:hypothetical protein IJM86_00780 [bacterium]|nr:hypothetical protein [bacterium]
MIKNLINNVKTKLFVRTFVATIYDKKVMHDFMKNFSKRGGDVFFLDLVDIVPFQKSFLV